MHQLPEIRLTVENATEEIPKLLHVIRPSWKKEQIELKKLIGGVSCLMYCCFNKENQDDGVTVRARTNMFKDFPHVRESVFEAKIIQCIHEEGLFTEVLATFQNGYCYTYVKGKPLYSYTMTSMTLDETQVRLMARKLAEIHSVKVAGCDYTETSYYRNLFWILKEKYPAEMTGDRPNREDLERELKQIEEKAMQSDSPLVLCHGDPHPGNIVYDKEKGLVTYVDWELTNVGFQAMDIAYALEVLKLIGINPAVKMDVPKDFERKYMRFYLEKWFEIKGEETPVLEEHIDKLESQANIFRLSGYLFWIILMVAQFTVAMPDHIDKEQMDDMKERMKQAQESSEAKDESIVKFDFDADPADHALQMVNIMFAKYLAIKEEVFGNDGSK